MLKKVIIDYRTSSDTVEELKRLGYEALFTKQLKSVYPEIQGHADIQLHLFNGKAFCAPDVYEYYREKLPELDVLCGSSEIIAKYPYDIAYNVCHLGKYAVCYTKYTAREILAEYVNKGIELLQTRQGYAKCNLCVVNDESIITSDAGLYKLLSAKGLNVLNVRAGNIRLYGMQGFIGGASGLLDRDVLAFNGDIRTHPDYDNIRTFCRDCGVMVLSLNSGVLCDIGSMIRA